MQPVAKATRPGVFRFDAFYNNNCFGKHINVYADHNAPNLHLYMSRANYMPTSTFVSNVNHNPVVNVFSSEVAFVGSSLIINWTLADNNIWVAPIFFQDKVPFDDLPMPYINGLTLLNATMNTILKAWQIQGTANLTSLLTTYKQKYLTAAGGESARDGVPKTLIILSASAAPDDVSSASQIALELIKQNITIITVALGPNVVSANQLQPISSGAAFSFQNYEAIDIGAINIATIDSRVDTNHFDNFITNSYGFNDSRNDD
uniref:VWFA domain-containing protein n=1 Tax=Plectus sambesii TaxID=2011161 RepID=A0A914XBT6_9BILA